MSNTRNICTSLTKGFSNLKKSITLRQDESTKLILPIMLTATSATVLALPSVAYAVFVDSLFPAYLVRGLVIGSLLGVGNVVMGRARNEDKPAEQLIDSQKLHYASRVIINGSINAKLTEQLLPVLRKAFQDKDSAGVVLQINSPGGTPVQSSIIHNEILKMKKQYKKKVIAVGEDTLASGAYYIATAADSIYVNKNTITGSIGVISHGFNLVELAKKVGVESRTHTAGNLKNQSNPLLPESKEEGQKKDEILKTIHEDFIAAVNNNRQNKLKGTPEKLFSGDYWTGVEALELGLVDHIGNFSDVLDHEFGVMKSKEYTSKSMIQSFLNIASKPSLDVSVSLDTESVNLKL